MEKGILFLVLLIICSFSVLAWGQGNFTVSDDGDGVYYVNEVLSFGGNDRDGEGGILHDTWDWWWDWNNATPSNLSSVQFISYSYNRSGNFTIRLREYNSDAGNYGHGDTIIEILDIPPPESLYLGEHSILPQSCPTDTTASALLYAGLLFAMLVMCMLAYTYGSNVMQILIGIVMAWISLMYLSGCIFIFVYIFFFFGMALMIKGAFG